MTVFFKITIHEKNSYECSPYRACAELAEFSML